MDGVVIAATHRCIISGGVVKVAPTHCRIRGRSAVEVAAADRAGKTAGLIEFATCDYRFLRVVADRVGRASANHRVVGERLDEVVVAASNEGMETWFEPGPGSNPLVRL